MRALVFFTLFVISLTGNAKSPKVIALEQAMLDGRVSITSFECSTLAHKGEDKRRLHRVGMERGRAFLAYAKKNQEKVRNTAQSNFGGLDWFMAADAVGVDLEYLSIDFTLGYVWVRTNTITLNSYPRQQYVVQYKRRNCDLIGR